MPNEEESKRTELEKGLSEFVEKNFPNALEEFEVIVKSLDSPDVNSTNIQNLVNAIYYVYLQSPADACSRLFILIRQFAKAYKEDEYLTKLDSLWTGSGKNALIIPTIETIVIRDMSNPFFIMGKRYNHGHGTTYTLGELNLRLQFVKKRMIDIFNEIYLKNDVQVPFSMPALMAGKGSEAMPEL